MTAEIWAAIAVLLLCTAAAAGVVALFRAHNRWDVIASGARLTATVSVSISLGLAVMAHGEWLPIEPRQMALGLVLAMLVIQMLLGWRLRIGSGGPVVDVVAVALILIGVFMFQRGNPLVMCTPRAWPFQVQWILFLLGGGGVLVAGSAGLMLAVRASLAGWGRELCGAGDSDLYSLLTEAIFLALVALGSGLVVGVWWAWRIAGSLSSGDLREGWIASAWVVGAMSQLAWQVESHRGRWAAGLAVAAAAIVILGLLWQSYFQGLAGI